MAIPVRSIRPKCPECGFSVFNRRFAKCESCGVQLPESITYTPDELTALREKDRLEEEQRQKALQQGRKKQNNGGGGGDGGDGSWLSDIDIDFSD